MVKLTNMSDRALSRMYAQNRIYDIAEGKKGTGTIIGVNHNGAKLRMQPKPIAPVEAYDAWLRSRNNYGGTRSPVTGAKLRRIVIMKRQGSTWEECGYAVGVRGGTAASWVAFLPFELSV